MPITREHIKIGLIVIVVAAFTFLMTSLLQGGKKKNELYNKLMQVYEDQKKDLKEQLKNEVDLRNDLQISYDQHMEKDSILKVLLEQNQAKYNSINKGYAEIPNRIKAISGNDVDIIRAFTDY